MDFSIKTSDPAKSTSPCLVIGAFQGSKPKLDPVGQRLDRLSRRGISAILKRGDLSGKPGSSLMLHDVSGLKSMRVLIVGLGSSRSYDLGALRKASAEAARQLKSAGVKSADVTLAATTMRGAEVGRRIRAVIESMQASLYHFDETKSGRKAVRSLRKVSLMVARNELAASRKGLTEGSAIANGVDLARTLGNLPGNICTPSYLARRAKSMQKTHGLKVSVLSEADMKKKKMGSLLSVSRGSREPAKLIVMEHKGGERSERPVVLVGKGLTFDAGGISIKPAAAMDEMKYDMCGGASVFGAMLAVAEMDLPMNVVGIVPASENLPDGAANKPGDIVTAMNGTTIEILNTDAEGRLILCDSLTYAERYKPAAVVDIATLTGACVIALGNHASGLFSNSDKLAKALLKAGEDAGDRAWQMPIWDEYTRQLQSNFADLANIGGRNAGAVTAACFLKHFAENFDWAHLDIAGTAWLGGASKGATGRPVPLLVEFLLNR
ncbi:MAG: leucyl aminopeptidase [Pseudomonadota bacterium]